MKLTIAILAALLLAGCKSYPPSTAPRETALVRYKAPPPPCRTLEVTGRDSAVIGAC